VTDPCVVIAACRGDHTVVAAHPETAAGFGAAVRRPTTDAKAIQRRARLASITPETVARSRPESMCKIDRGTRTDGLRAELEYQVERPFGLPGGSG